MEKTKKYNFDVISCEVTSKATQRPLLKACVRNFDGQTRNLEFYIEEEDLVIGNEKKVYDKINSYIKQEEALVSAS
jgi:hypothetical protein